MITTHQISKGEISELHVKFISLLRTKNPANRRPVYIKDDGENTFSYDLAMRLVSFTKGDIEKGIKPQICIVIYEPGVEDTQGDFASAEVIERAAHEFLMMKRVGMIDTDHDFISGAGTIVQSFILNGPDARFPDARIGSWVAVVEPSDEMLPHIDTLKGCSLAGTGAYAKAAETVERMIFLREDDSERVPQIGFAKESPQIHFL